MCVVTFALVHFLIFKTSIHTSFYVVIWRNFSLLLVFMSGVYEV